MKITPRENKTTVTVKTKANSANSSGGYKWWLAPTKDQAAREMLSTFTFLKEMQQYRYRQSATFARLYGNLPLFNFVGSNMSKMSASQTLPIDRPTMNVIQSCVDTLVSRITQSRPRPVFLTDNADYHERNLGKQLNNFSAGELYQTKAYELGPLVLRDAAVLGTGVLKIYESKDKKVALERKLFTDLLVDPNEALYEKPRQLFEMKLVDREVLQDLFPKFKSDIAKAEQAYPDASGESTKTVSDMVMVVEGWRLPSSKEAGDGRHMIACSSGPIFDEEWDKEDFPFVFMHYSPRLLGFWGQGLAEQLMGTQVSINKILIQMERSIELITPVWLVEDGSKMVKSHFNNSLGRIQTYRGTLPTYQAPDPYSATLPDQLMRLVQFAYQQSGISALAATSQKPAGLNSGEALRNYDELQSDRFASLSKRYDQIFVDLNYKIIDFAKDIAERDGKYQTVYPNKNGTKQIDLPDAKLLDNPFVIQCFDSSSLPRDPAGRLEKVTEMMQAGIIDPAEGRRLLDYPDLEQVERLANSGEERILQILDKIIDKGEYTPPDPFMDLALAQKLVTQYYNLYSTAKLEEEKAEMLRTFAKQIQDIQQAAMPQAPAAGPQAVPAPRPTSPMLPNVPTQ
jgi:hypothetical protein